MKLQIKPQTTLAEIQNKFQKAFPLLKIEFFKKPHRIGQPSPKKDLVNNGLTVSSVTDNHGEISINGKMKISELEQQLREKFGLNIQVFCKMGTTWIQTSKTDNMTLEEQQISAKGAQTKYTYSLNTITNERD